MTGWIWDMVKLLPDGVQARLNLGDGILAGAMSESPKEQTLKAVTLTRHAGERAEILLGAIPELVFSELVRDQLRVL